MNLIAISFSSSDLEADFDTKGRKILLKCAKAHATKMANKLAAEMIKYEKTTPSNPTRSLHKRTR